MTRLTRRALLGAAAGLALTGASQVRAESFWGRRPSDGPKEFIFGYGSLINTPSREATGRGRIDAVSARVSPAFGYVRSWVARSPSGFTALGLRPAAPGEEPSSINGVVFPVDGDNLPRFDRRESGYDRVAVPRAAIEGVSWQGLPPDGVIWAYVPKSITATGAPLLLPDADHPLVQSYIDLVLEGALEYGPDFARELVATTSDWGRFWLNDRTTARRPWIATPEAGRMDDILARTQPAAAAFPHRLYGEEYAARILRAPAGEGAK